MSTALLLSLILSLSAVFILPLTNKKFRAQMARDPVQAILFGVAAVLALAFLFLAPAAARTHHFEILKDLLLATGVFAVVGIVFGLTRSLRKRSTDRAI
jgi:hypothetical protein